jgi:hypothetical protein
MENTLSGSRNRAQYHGSIAREIGYADGDRQPNRL